MKSSPIHKAGVRLVAVCLVVPVLFSQTDLKQLLKLPVFIEHYAEHKAKNNLLTMYDFFVMHYIGDDFDATDNDKDSQLPFKSQDRFANVHFGEVTLPEDVCMNCLFSVSLIYKENYLPGCTVKSICDIWQPPRLA